MKKILIVTVIALIGEFVSAQTGIGNQFIANRQTNANLEANKNWQGTAKKEASFYQQDKIWMWSHSNLGQGTTLHYNFVSGQKYQITFKVKTSSNIAKPNQNVLNATVNVKATSGLTASKSSYQIPMSSENTETIWTSQAAKKWNKWKTVTVEFTATYANDQLWFYPLMTANANDNGGARIQMEVKDIIITPMPISYVSNITSEMAMTMN